jgi:hypothetical protein
LLLMARDGSRMLADLSSGRDPGPGDEAWRDELERAEACRVDRDRKGEQRHYRAAVRAWRAARRQS